MNIKRMLPLVFLVALPRVSAGQPTGAISGKVVLASSNAPVAGLTIGASNSFFDHATATTDAAGVYTISGLDPGNYFVRTRAAATSPLRDTFFNDLCTACGDQPHTVTVAAGATRTGIDFKLSDFTGGISGTLTFAPLPFTGPAAIPVVQVYDRLGVLVKSVTPVPGPGASTGSTTPPTPAGGTFTWTIAGLAAGTYYVRTSNPRGWLVDELYDNSVCVAADCSPVRGTPIAVFAAAGGASPTTGINITLEYGATISGALPVITILSAAGVNIYDSRGVRLPDRLALVTPFFDGYIASGLPAGTYYVVMQPIAGLETQFPSTLYKDIPCPGCAVTSGTPVPVVLGESKTGIDFTALPAGAIKGTVRSNGSGVGNVTVDVFAANGALAGRKILTPTSGAYTIWGLSSGSYYARTTNSSGYADTVYGAQSCDGCDPVGGTPIAVVTGADTTAIDFDLVKGGTISGLLEVFLTPAPGVIGPVQYPVPNVGVTVYTPSNTIAARTTSDPFGIFSATVPPGTYYVQTDPTPGYATTRYGGTFCPQGVCAPGAGAAVTIAADITTTANITMTPVCSTMSIAPVTLAAAAVGSPYRQTLIATGGVDEKRYAIAAGTLPPGLFLDPATGVLSGTPTASGHFTFTVSAAGEIGCATTRSYTLDVPACVMNVVATPVSRAGGDPFLIPVSTNCSSWTASSNASWIQVASVHQGPPSAVLIVTSPYTGTTPRTGTVTIGSRVITVYQNGVSPAPPFGVLDTPVNGAVVSGSVAVTGWALDDIAVSRVLIYRDAVAGEGPGQPLIGEATIVERARPDVEAAFPAAPRNWRAGFGYLLLSNMLPNGGNGTFKIYAYAEDNDLNRILLGARTIVATNSTATTPFGAIDTPAQGGTIAGSAYINWGWALTPQPTQIPFDGSTIDVVIDGVPVGKVTSYNLFRSDVSGLFPGLKNSGGPVGYRAIDTTALSEGMHTIAWVVTDDLGQASGIGSRYFTVQNSAWLPSLKSAAVAVPPAFSPSEIALADRTTAVPPRIDGIDISRRSASLASLPVLNQADAVRTVDLKPLQGLELALSKVGDEAACASTYEGYLSANGELRALPIGSSLDPKGTFYWQPGPGFFGAYQFLFVRTTCAGERSRIPVSVRIH